VIREEGYDGEYGTIRLFAEAEKQAIAGQMALFAPAREKRSGRKILPSVRKKAAAETQALLVKDPVSQTDPILGPLPGTGKTMTLTHKIAYLIRSGLAAPEQILALTFTRKAAKEMEQRISTLLGDLGIKEVRVATFHGFCLDILRNEKDKTDLPTDFMLCSEVDAGNIAKEILSGSGGGEGPSGYENSICAGPSRRGFRS
ncbi:MAG: UvrD-helicase domain-containing protein, partial [Deltaproteobacteria bacterium]|nr:UvrD-helicase domain-containing protein [Deltaproteobacteria bacterium]